MREEKKGGSPETPDYKRGLAREGEGEQAYGRLAFAESRDAFRDATGLYAKAKVPVSAPPPPPPPTGSILITANMDADVWVGNQKIKVGRQAIEVGQLPPGRYTVKATATRSGYTEWKAEVDVKAGSQIAVPIRLQPRSSMPPPSF
jgi:hypothetical protein